MKNSQAVLTIDIGSSSIRVSICDMKQNLLHFIKERHFPDEVFDIQKCWNCLEELISKLVGEHPDYDIVSVCTSALIGWVFVDAAGNPLTQAFSWMDHKPEQKEKFLNAMPEEEFFRRNGRKLSDELGGLKLRYLKDSCKEKYDDIACMLSIKDYINFKFTGKFGMDYTTACYTMLLNVHDMKWDKKIAQDLSIDIRKMPQLYASSEVIGNISEETALNLGLEDSAFVVAGGPDGSVGVLGAGGTRPGRSVSVMGTSDVFFAVSNKFILDASESLVTNPHVIPGYWLIGGPTGLCGGTLDWFSENILEQNYSLEQLGKLSEHVEEGSGGMLFVPSLSGERTPFWDAGIRGTICGIRRDHKAQHIFRAIMESNGYVNRRIIEISDQLGVRTDQIIAIGGGAKSSLWLKIKADITRKPVMVPENFEATTRGCAILAGYALSTEKAIDDFTNPVIRTTQPNENSSKMYDKSFKKYLRLMEACSDFYIDHD